MKKEVLCKGKRRCMLAVLFAVATAALLGLGYGWLVRKGYGIPCLFFMVTGLRCPGCGISRSLAALLALRVDRFLEPNLLSPLILLYIFWVCFSAGRNYVKEAKLSYRPFCKWVDIAMLALTIAWWVVRNFLGI